LRAVRLTSRTPTLLLEMSDVARDEGARSDAARSEVDHHLDRLAVVHSPVAVGHPVEVRRAIEDASGLDPAVEDVRKQLLDIGARRRGAAGDRDRDPILLASWTATLELEQTANVTDGA
jgi:hypothetical protein